MSDESASVEERRFRGEPAMRVAAGALSAQFLPGLGMTGVSLRFGGHEYLALPGGLRALRSGATLGIPLLAPWANRLSVWRYRAAGVDVDLRGRPLGTDDNGLPIHGLLVGRPGWRIQRTSARGGAASFVAVVDVDDPAFPFPHRIEVGVTARDGALTLDTAVVPTGSRPVPVAFGWHPYLRLPGPPRTRWKLCLPARRHLTLDARGIPDGGETSERAEAEQIGNRTFDDLYALGRATTLALESDETVISMQAGSGYSYAQVWVPKGRPFAALEPMTTPTNSLVDGTAPTVAPGDRYRATFTLAVGR
jgi:galactose mutarotase-like enzyme